MKTELKSKIASELIASMSLTELAQALEDIAEAVRMHATDLDPDDGIDDEPIGPLHGAAKRIRAEMKSLRDLADEIEA